MIQRFFKGFGFVLRGWNLSREIPLLRSLLFIPFILDLILMWIGIYFGAERIHRLVNRAIFSFYGSDENVYSHFAFYFLLILFWVVFILFFFYFIYLFAAIIASPFYSLIAEKVLRHNGQLEGDGFTTLTFIRHSLRMLGISILRSLILLFFGVLLFFISFIPALNLISSFAVFLILALNSADFAFDAKRYSLRQRFQFFGRHLPEFFGMAAFVGLTALVPGLILLVMPLAVVGASAIVGENDPRKNS